jgi:hypothetical protein
MTAAIASGRLASGTMLTPSVVAKRDRQGQQRSRPAKRNPASVAKSGARADAKFIATMLASTPTSSLLRSTPDKSRARKWTAEPACDRENHLQLTDQRERRHRDLLPSDQSGQ